MKKLNGNFIVIYWLLANYIADNFTAIKEVLVILFLWQGQTQYTSIINLIVNLIFLTNLLFWIIFCNQSMKRKKENNIYDVSSLFKIGSTIPLLVRFIWNCLHVNFAILKYYVNNPLSYELHRKKWHVKIYFCDFQTKSLEKSMVNLSAVLPWLHDAYYMYV